MLALLPIGRQTTERYSKVTEESKQKTTWVPSRAVKAIINTHWPSSDMPVSPTEKHMFAKRMRLMQYDLLLLHIPEMDDETQERAMRNLAKLEEQLAAT